MSMNPSIHEQITETLKTVILLPDDFTYDTLLFDHFDGRPHLSLSSIQALELVVLIYETWDIDVPMEDVKKLSSVNAIAEYIINAQKGAF